MNNNEISNKVFSNYGTLLAKVSDLKKILRILIKNKITLAYQQDTVYANSIDNVNQKEELEHLKKMNLKIEGDKDFTYLKVNWSESENNPIVSAILRKNGFNFYFMGDDGSWLARPYYLVTSKQSHDEIKTLAQQGYFKDVSSSLWNILAKRK